LLCNEPDQAHRLVRWVESQLPPWGRLLAPARRARIARERLLTPRRLDRDFASDRVVVIDGWVLARTEGAVAVYISNLSSPSPLNSLDSPDSLEPPDPSTL
jgi:hypothetical protein